MFELERIVAPEVSMVAMALLSLPQLNYIPAMEVGGEVGKSVIVSLMGSLAIIKNSHWGNAFSKPLYKDGSPEL